MKLSSSLLILCGDTFFTTEILNVVSNEKLFWCESLACIDSALFSHLSSFLKQLRWLLVQMRGKITGYLHVGKISSVCSKEKTFDILFPIPSLADNNRFCSTFHRDYKPLTTMVNVPTIHTGHVHVHHCKISNVWLQGENIKFWYND